MKTKHLIDIFSEKPTACLYHYTNQAGLLGIIREKEIWATHCRYLNDAREFLHALDLVRAEVDDILKATSVAGERAFLEKARKELDRLPDLHICVASFSEVGDSLSQWRAYGGPTAGYAVGIPGDHLASLAEKHNFHLARCIYDSDEQREFVRGLIQTAMDETVPRPTKRMNPERSARSVYNFLVSQDVSEQKVRNSEVPFRNW